MPRVKQKAVESKSWIVPYTKTVHGEAVVDAETPEQAEAELLSALGDRARDQEQEITDWEVRGEIRENI